MPEISESDFEVIQEKCKAGDLLVEKCRYKEAVREYNIAYSLIPEPKAEHEATTWVLTAIGDACFLGKLYKSAMMHSNTLCVVQAHWEILLYT